MRRNNILKFIEALVVLSLVLLPPAGGSAAETGGGKIEGERPRVAALYALYYAPEIPENAIEKLRYFCEKSKIALLFPGQPS